MRIPDSLLSLVDYGIIDEVLRPLMAGKEAQVYLVRLSGECRVAKVYKEAQNRTFKNRAEYTEGRKVRNTRDQRAMSSGSRHGRAQAEAAWRTTEVDMIYRLRDAGVRVPRPYNFIDGVLVMEMVTDEFGDPAPRLGDVALEAEGARAVFESLLAEVVRMLAAGVVHGDLSDFNVLMGTEGPVIIDFPQAVDASSNQNARKLLLRDVDNLHRYRARFEPEYRPLPYAQEMWALYERGQLTPDTKLSGRHQASEAKVSTESVLGLIGDAARDERRRREGLGLSVQGVPDGPEAPKPQSRYAQKREAQREARLLEAASNPPPQRNAPRESPRQAAPGQQRNAPRETPRQAAPGQRNAPRESPRQVAPGQQRNAPREAPRQAVHEQQRRRTTGDGHAGQRAGSSSQGGRAQPAGHTQPRTDVRPGAQARPQHDSAATGNASTVQKRRRRRRRGNGTANAPNAPTR